MLETKITGARSKPWCSPSLTAAQRNGGRNDFLAASKALYPGRRFPAPEDVLATPDARLRGAGLSRAKTAAIKDLAAHALGGMFHPRARLGN